MTANPQCSWGSCVKAAASIGGGMCGMHRMRQSRGTPAMDAPAPRPRGLPLSQMYRVSESGCWEWLGYVAPGGYGLFRRGYRLRVLAHRAMWELHRGPIPDGLVIDHLCRNTACVNPDHLEPVTVGVNNWRGMAPNFVRARENRCKRGHEFTPENTQHQGGSRTCKQCKADRQRARAAAKASA